MPRPRTSMRKTKEILRLSLKEGLTQRQIAQSTGVGKTTVQDILARAKDFEWDWDRLADLREHDIVRRLLPTPKHVESKPEPDWVYVHQEMMKKGNTLALLWLDFKQEHPEGFSYSRYCEHYKRWKSKSSLTMRQQHPAGKKLFVDFSGLCVPWLDMESGELQKAEIFVAVLGASNYTFAKAVANQSSALWIDCHISALEYFDGVPEVIVPDNLRSGVSRVCRYDPDANPTYLAFAEYYGTAIIPTRAYKPRDKAKVEVGVQVVQRWILAILRRQTFTSVSEINQYLRPLLDNLNRKLMRHLCASRRDLYESVEKPALKPLPAERYTPADWKIAKVNIDYHIEFERHYYSVPHQFVGKAVDIKATTLSIEVYQEGKRIAIHPRWRGSLGQHTTQKEHMPPAHQAHAEWTPERILGWAEQSGPRTSELCRRILESRTHPEQGYRACLGIMRLGKQNGYDRLENACDMAITMRSLRYKTIKDILKNESDRKVRTLKIVKPTQIEPHENIRGAEYYS